MKDSQNFGMQCAFVPITFVPHFLAMSCVHFSVFHQVIIVPSVEMRTLLKILSKTSSSQHPPTDTTKCISRPQLWIDLLGSVLLWWLLAALSLTWESTPSGRTSHRTVCTCMPILLFERIHNWVKINLDTWASAVFLLEILLIALNNAFFKDSLSILICLHLAKVFVMFLKWLQETVSTSP